MEETVTLDRANYEELIDGSNFTAYVNFFVQQVTPSRLNFLFDFMSMCLGFYFNSWVIFMWFFFIQPINWGFEVYFLAFPLADLPPFFDTGRSVGEEYDMEKWFG